MIRVNRYNLPWFLAPRLWEPKVSILWVGQYRDMALRVYPPPHNTIKGYLNLIRDNLRVWKVYLHIMSLAPVTYGGFGKTSTCFYLQQNEGSDHVSLRNQKDAEII